jgi:hypothetical protein
MTHEISGGHGEEAEGHAGSAVANKIIHGRAISGDRGHKSHRAQSTAPTRKIDSARNLHDPRTTASGSTALWMRMKPAR